MDSKPINLEKDLLKSYFWPRVYIHDNLIINNCWFWHGTIDRDNYGQIIIKNKKILAHRLSYYLFNGPLISGLCITHKCDNPGCVNPSHLEQKTSEENTIDREVRERNYMRNITSCKRGHKLEGSNLKINNRGDRVCLKCERIRYLNNKYSI